MAALLSGCAPGSTAGGPFGQDGQTASAAKVNRIAARLLANNFPECREASKHAAEQAPPACTTQFVVTWSNEVNARATRSSVRISDGMMRFVRNDEELAFVLAHELAHVTLGHFGSDVAYTGRTMLEYEADEEAVKLLHNAGFDVSRAPGILKRLAHKYRGHDRYATSHPSFDERWQRVSGQIQRLKDPQQAADATD